jgi:hypothetical protein
MNRLAGLVAILGLASILLLRTAAAGTVTLDVEFKLTDRDYHPIAGVPLRLVLGAEDWQAPEAGIRIVTNEDGGARFTTQSVVDRTWRMVNVGSTPIAIPVRVDHIAIAAELERILPGKDGDVSHRWLYTADIYRYADGDCSTDDLDGIYEAGPNGRFTRLLGEGAAGPNFKIEIGGLILSGAGYKLWDFMLSPEDADGHWHLKLALMRMPKPVLR